METKKIKPPKHLNPVAKAYWRRILPALEGMQLEDCDRESLGELCVIYSEIVKLDEVIAEKGRTMVINDNGYEMPRPEINMRNNAWEKFYKYLNLFGLSPASRKRMNTLPADKNEDPLDSFINKK
jgi:P27 family predicted phage terminase small subunit